MPNCIMCGCDEQTACYHPEDGNCCWTPAKFPLCNQCASATLIPGSERNNLTGAPPFTKALLKKYLDYLGFKVSITSPGKKHYGHKEGHWTVSLRFGDPDYYDDLMTRLFDPISRPGPGSWSFKPTDLTIRKEELP